MQLLYNKKTISLNYFDPLLCETHIFVKPKTMYIASGWLLVVILNFIDGTDGTEIIDVGSIADLIQPGEKCYEKCTAALPKEYYWESYCMVCKMYSYTEQGLYVLYVFG